MFDDRQSIEYEDEGRERSKDTSPYLRNRVLSPPRAQRGIPLPEMQAGGSRSHWGRLRDGRASATAGPDLPDRVAAASRRCSSCPLPLTCLP